MATGLEYLAGFGLGPCDRLRHGLVREGESLVFDENTELALVLSGTWRAMPEQGVVLAISGPSVILDSDLQHAPATAIQDLRLLHLDHENCCQMLSCDDVFRELFFHCMTARIRATKLMHMPVSRFAH